MSFSSDKINWKELSNDDMIALLKAANERADELQTRVKQLEAMLRERDSEHVVSSLGTAHKQQPQDEQAAYEEYKLKYVTLKNKKVAGLIEPLREEFQDMYREYKSTNPGKAFTGNVITEAILNTREATVNELTAAYQNLMNHYNPGGSDRLSNVIDKYIADGNVLPTLEDWIASLGGVLYNQYLCADGAEFRDYALGS